MSITSVANDLVTSVSVINALKPLPPTISGYSVGGVDDTALDPAGGQTVQINGTGFLAGATITFDGSAVAVVTYVNPNQLTFTSPAKSAGTYTIYVVNADGGTAIYIPGIIYSVLPSWTTSAGTLGSYYETTSISNTVIASGDAPITYSLFSGSLPTGSTLYANGVITGTAPVDSSSTTYSFTIQATDAQFQDSTRSFSLTINVDAVTWVTPSSGATYTNAVDSAIANVALSATDAAGYAVSYSANALPTGLTLTGSNIAGTPTVIADSSTLLTATAATTTRSATRTINWSITVANDVYFEYNTLLIPGASTTFVDDTSTNNFAVTIAGDTKPNSFNPYTPGYYSNYFDGTGDYISVPDNVAFTMAAGDFTLECWVNLSTISGSQIIIGTCDAGGSQGSMSFVLNVNSGTPRIGVGYGGTMYFATAASAITANTWVHIAGVRNGASVYIYVNGIQSTALNMGSLAITDSTQVVAVGRNGAGNFEYVTGYISNVRIVKGTAVYTGAFTPPTLAPLTNAGSTSAAAYPSTTNVDITFASSATSLLTSQSNRFIDTSINEFPVTVSGDTKIQSFQPFTPNSSYSLYGSGYFDGTGDYLTPPVNAALALGTGEFTIECWVYFINSVANHGVFQLSTSLWPAATSGLAIYVSGGTGWGAYYNGTGNNGTPAPMVNTWYHVALVRSGTTTKLYVNGSQILTATDTTNYTGTYLSIGGYFSTSYLMTGYISDFRIVKGTAVYTTTFTPPSEPLTAIANTSLLTLQNNQSVNNNVFLDNSTNNFFVTRNGNTTQGTFSPYGGNWSNYFDGTGDYLNTPSNAAFGFGTGDFTIEGWFYFTGTISTYQRPWWFGDDNDNLEIFSSVIRFGGANETAITGPTAVANTWYHIAYTRQSSSGKLFVNGTQVGSTTASSYNSSARTFTLMATSGGANPSTGYVSNFRIIKGTALYTTTFTPSTTPLTVISGTSLLTCQSNRLIDNSTNNFTITKNGDVSVQRFSPFNPSSLTPTSYSGYFDGTGDYLTAPSNSALAFPADFTIECWVYPLAWATNAPICSGSTGAVQLSKYGANANLGVAIQGLAWHITDAALPTLNTWSHVALTRSGSTLKIFINGVQSGSTGSTAYSFTTTNLIGGDGTSYFQGYMTNYRVVKGTSVYTGAFTVPTSPLAATQTSGTNIAAITGTSTSLLTLQSPTFIDNSTNNFTITAAGNSQPTQQNPFGYTSATTQGYTASTIGGSGYFDGSGDFLTVPTNAAFNVGNTWTVECWYYPVSRSNTYPCIISIYGGSYANAIVLFDRHNGASTKFSFAVGSGTLNAGTTTVVDGTWYHIALVSINGVVTMYVNGTSEVTANLTAGAVNKSVYIGANFDYASYATYINGYLSDTRVVASAIYTSNFVPPSAPLLAIQNTTLLTNMTSAGIYDAAMMTTMETVGDAKLSTAVSKFGGTSMAFDGTGDRLNTSPGVINSLGSGDFTIEGWVYPSSLSSFMRILSQGTYTTGEFLFILYSNGSADFCEASTSRLSFSAGSFVVGAWEHFAIVRSGSGSNNLKGYINGTLAGTGTSSSYNFSATTAIYVGSNPTTSGQDFPGYIDDLRITKGFARYTANFTAPTTAFPIY